MQSSKCMSRLFCNLAYRRYSSNVRMPTLNDLPQPKGDWQTNYDALNRRYTLHLLLGIGMLAGTLVFGKAAGLLEMYNDYPEKPAVIDNYKVNK